MASIPATNSERVKCIRAFLRTADLRGGKPGPPVSILLLAFQVQGALATKRRVEQELQDLPDTSASWKIEPRRHLALGDRLRRFVGLGLRPVPLGVVHNGSPAIDIALDQPGDRGDVRVLAVT
jgi:hypothetical protein